MTNKPNFENFIGKNLLGEYIYYNKTINKYYIEKNAYMHRLIGEIIICFLPILTLATCLLTLEFGVYKSILLELDWILLAILIILIYPMRYFVVEFIEYDGQKGNQNRKRYEVISVICFFTLKYIVKYIILYDLIH